jgi:putative transposase
MAPERIPIVLETEIEARQTRATVAKYMVRTRKPPSQTWRTFLANHVADIAACDFFTVPTVTFRVFCVLIVLRHDRRRVVHFNVTTNPYAEWTAQQIINAFPYEEVPRFLIRDRDEIYSVDFTERVEGMGIEEVPTAPRSPWQNPYCERVIGSIRRECLNHVIVLSEGHPETDPGFLLGVLSRQPPPLVAGSQLADSP